MRKTALVSTLAIAALPTLSSTQTNPNAPSYCKGYQPELIGMDGFTGAYMRVSPDGNYAIVSSQGSSILDLTKKDSNGKRVAKVINTQMNNEAYPVEGNWNYIASPGNAMSFYRFKDLLEKGRDATPGEIVDRRSNSRINHSGQAELFVDDEHTALYYHSAAELPGGNKSHATYRVSLYEQDTFRDYEVWFNPDGSAAKVEKKEIKPLCQNLLSNGQSFDDNHISQPILSKNGTEMAGLWKGTTHIFKVNSDGTCEVEDDLGIITYKVSFSYPESGKRSKIVFTDARSNAPSASTVSGAFNPSQAFNDFGTFIYDPNTKKMTPLSLDSMYNGTPVYPGWTKDGRILTEVQTPQGIAIAVINPKKLVPLPDITQIPNTKIAKNCFQDVDTYTQAVTSLGDVWNSICSQYTGGIQSNELGQMEALSLDPKICVKMVHENYQTWKDQHPSSSLTEAHLAAVCKSSH